MSPAVEDSPGARSLPELRLLLELEPRGPAFRQNLKHFLGKRPHPLPFPQNAPLRSDVLLPSRMPWPSFSESVAYHILAMAAILAWLHWTPRHITQIDPWKDTRVITYPLTAQKQADLPKLDTGSAAPRRAQQGDPVLNRQPILSVPQEPDNRAQTIVTPPDIVLRNEVKMPNIVAWTSLPLAPPASAAGLVSERTFKAPEVSVVAPPPQVEPERRNRMEMLQTAAVAPPAELKETQALKNAATLTSVAVEPAPQVNSLTMSKLGVMNMGHTDVVAPAPKLAVGEQRAMDQAAGGRATAAQALATAAVPPPPSLSGSTAPGAGRMIALGLHPDAPPGAVVPPPGNRRGEFEAGPSGKANASGKATIPETGKTTDRASGTGGTSQNPDLPAGLKVGDPKQSGANVGDPSGVPTTTASISIERYPLASATLPRVSANRRPAVVVDHPPTDAEKKVFGGRRFYSMTLNMPNLNSAGGSWIVRFAELKEGPNKGELFSPLMTRKSDPAYPLELQRANVQGTVALYAIIHSDGSVRDIRVLDSVDDQLDHFASEALAKCKFEPAIKNGEPVALEAVILVPFRARRGF